MKKIVLPLLSVFALVGCGMITPVATTTAVPTTTTTPAVATTTTTVSPTTTTTTSPATTTTPSPATTTPGSTTTTITTTQAMPEVSMLEMSNYEYSAYEDYSNAIEYTSMARDFHTCFDVTIPHYKSVEYYTNRLAEPKVRLESRDDLIQVLDFMAFYGVERWEFEFSYTVTDVWQEIVDAFWSSYLCPSSVGVAYSKNNSYVTLKMYFNHQTNNLVSNYEDTKPSTIPYTFYSTGEKRSATFDNFPYKTANTKGTLDVYNSEQLMYALEFGYVPNILPDSPAETLYNKATDVLRKIIYDDMTEYDKILAMESYIFSTVSYDYTGDDYASYKSAELPNYPDIMASGFTSFYAEGPLLYGKSVCQGYAKALNILMTIEGIKAYKVSTIYDDALKDGKRTLNSVCYSETVTGSGTYSSHGYSYVLDRNDNKYYVCDSTFNEASSLSIAGCIVGLPRNFAAMKAYNDWHQVYSGTIEDGFHAAHTEQIGTISHNWAEDFKIKVGNLTMDLYVTSTQELTTLLTNLDTYIYQYDDEAYISTNRTYAIQIFFDDYNSNADAYDNIFYGCSSRFDWWSTRMYGNTQMGAIVIFLVNN